MTQDDAIMQAVPWLLAALGGGGILRALYVAHRAAKAMETVEALDKLVRGNGGDDWSFPETRRRLRAALRKVDEFEEVVHGEHGLYSKFAVLDSKIIQWATWRHDVMDRDMNRLALEIGGHDGDIEDIRKELAMCERRK